ALRVQDRFGSRPILTSVQWDKLDKSVDRALVFLARTQERDGSFRTHESGQPAVTSLCAMAFLSRGHVPGEGTYQDNLGRAVDYVLNSQAGDGTMMVNINARASQFEANYNHAIAGLMLGEVYGMTSAPRQDRIRTAIERALQLTRKEQARPKRFPEDRGGWRYMRQFGDTDADLSVTAWELMFLRSARNAEFDVPEEWITEAMDYVRRTFDRREQGFRYGLRGEDSYCSRGMVGAGVVALSLGGEHDSEMTQLAGKWILRNSFDRYNGSNHPEDRYHYSAFYCSQAMFQLGGEYWFDFFPSLLDVLVANQKRDGSWAPESNSNDSKYGNLYSTALTVLALTPAYQILPIYQR
ncbi:MAG: prenyltransferase/squalene oxidase repeat-containing protein, partial [Planctomycetaceae bacterium]